MVIDIVVGKKFSQLKLLYLTNLFFRNRKKCLIPQKIISASNRNYVLSIGKRNIKVLFSSESNQSDFNIIRKYIENTFEGRSIGIYNDQAITFLDEIEKVRIYKYCVNQMIRVEGKENEGEIREFI